MWADVSNCCCGLCLQLVSTIICPISAGTLDTVCVYVLHWPVQATATTVFGGCSLRGSTALRVTALSSCTLAREGFAAAASCRCTLPALCWPHQPSSCAAAGAADILPGSLAVASIQRQGYWTPTDCCCWVLFVGLHVSRTSQQVLLALTAVVHTLLVFAQYGIIA